MDGRRTTTAVTGATISLLEWAPIDSTGPAVLLLRGGGADNADLSWTEVGAAIADAGYRVIAPDHPGFGRSPRANWPLTQQNLIRYVGELVDALDLDDYVIGGLSLGGGLALGHLLDRPDAARGAMLLGSFGIMPRLTDGPFSRLNQLTTFALLRTGLLAALTRGYARNAGAMERGLRTIVCNPAARTPELVRAVVEEAASGDSLRTFGEWQRDQVLCDRLRTDYTDRLRAIQTPALLVHGDRDNGVPVARAQAAARQLPHSTLVTVPGAGHWVQRDRPDLVIPALLAFLEGLD